VFWCSVFVGWVVFFLVGVWGGGGGGCVLCGGAVWFWFWWFIVGGVVDRGLGGGFLVGICVIGILFCLFFVCFIAFRLVGCCFYCGCKVGLIDLLLFGFVFGLVVWFEFWFVGGWVGVVFVVWGFSGGWWVVFVVWVGACVRGRVCFCWVFLGVCGAWGFGFVGGGDWCVWWSRCVAFGGGVGCFLV